MDKYNEIKRRLYGYGALIAEKQELDIRYEELKENLGVKAISYAEGHGSGISNTTEKEGLKLAEEKEKIVKFRKTKGLEILRIENALSILNEKEMEFVKTKYFDKRRPDTIPEILGISRRTCSRRNKDALMKIDSIINLKI